MTVSSPRIVWKVGPGEVPSIVLLDRERHKRKADVHTVGSEVCRPKMWIHLVVEALDGHLIVPYCLSIDFLRETWLSQRWDWKRVLEDPIVRRADLTTSSPNRAATRSLMARSMMTMVPARRTSRRRSSSREEKAVEQRSGEGHGRPTEEEKLER